VLRAGAVWGERWRELRSLLALSPWPDGAPQGRGQARPRTLLDALCAVLKDPRYPLDLDASLRLQGAGILVERELGVHVPRNRLYRGFCESLCPMR
jgi:hypothetical protein